MPIRISVLVALYFGCFCGTQDCNASALPTTTDSSDSVVYYETTEQIPGTTTIEEYFPRNFGSENESGIQNSSVIEETTITPQASQFQAEVLNELEDLWNYSENLDESQSALKTSLVSLVHLTYGRLQTEPEETLDRLKYMLQKLKTKLTQEANGESNPVVHTRKRRSILDDMDQIFGIGEVENVLNPSEYLNQVYNINKKNLLEQTPSSSPLPAPNDATIQKIIRVEDGYPSIPSTTPMTFNHVSEFFLAQPNPSTAQHGATKGFRTTTPPSVTAEQIADSILKLLNKNYNGGTTTVPAFTTYPTTTPAQTTYSSNYMIPILNQEFPEKNPEMSQTFLYFQQYMKKLRKKQKQREKLKNAIKLYGHLRTTTTSRTTPLPLPSYFQNNHNYFIGQSEADNELEETLTSFTLLQPYKPEPTTPRQAPTTLDNKRRTTTSTRRSSPSDYDFLLENTDMAETDVEPATVSSEVLTPVFSHILDELASTSVVITPASFLNGTREGFAVFVSTFNGLTFATKMVLLFVLSVSVLSIALGIYSLGPPIIAVGALGILIPIVLLVLLQQAEEKQRMELKEVMDGIETKPGDKLDNVLDLVSDAIKKYGTDI